ncbi:tetratricopeptide repeat protein [Cyclobacterium plantarum]|uniref:Tetratricopeptide repeat protein n=1 Tax=Cyclobacterium plantarum TaxID=2716263 RepID=A0ABX0HF59_9BACT|nr:tetratricopeptide repeat protein [Cyclobacterium plantarum]NHE58969.1 tetratricopeptide repeat protein [Cyclobacterium plantarum]
MYRFLFLLVCSLVTTTALQAQSPFLDAIGARDLPQVQQLVKAGADVNALDENGATPLMWAAYQADLEMVKWLVDNGADPFQKKGAIFLNEEKTAYYGNLTGIAAGEGKLEMLQFLIGEVGIAVDDKEYNPETGQEDGWTAAQWADSGVHGDVMAYLEKRADLTFLSDTLRRTNVDITKGATFYKESSYKASMILFEKHITLLKETFGATDTSNYATFLYVLANACKQSGNYGEAEQYYSELTVLWKSVLGEDHPSYAISLHNLAVLYEQMGRYAEAEPLERQILEIFRVQLGEDHPNYAIALNNLAITYAEMGRYAEAEPLHTQALQIHKQQLGEDHPEYARSLNNLALAYKVMGRYAEAEPLYKQALEIRKEQLGKDHPDYANSLDNLALLYEKMGRYAEAEPRMRKASEIWKVQLGADHPEYASSLNNLAGLYQTMGRYAEAEPLYAQAMGIRKTQMGENHPDYASSLNNLAGLYQTMGRYPEAEPLYAQAMEIRKTQLGENHPSYAASLNNLAGLYQTMGRYAEAEPLYAQAMGIWKAKLGENHPDYAASLNNLANLYEDLGRYTQAEPLYTQAMEIMKTKLGEYHPDYGLSLNNLAKLYQRMGMFTEAEPLYKQSMGIQKEQLGEDHPDYANSLNNLSELFKNMGRYAEAEPLLLQSQQVYLHQLRTIFPTLSEKEKEQFLHTFNFSFEFFNTFTSKRRGDNPEITAPQYDNALLLKGLLLKSSSQMRDRILAGGDTTAIRLFGDWQTLKRQWLQESDIPKSEREKGGIAPEATLEKANTLEKELSLLSEAFAEATDTVRTTWREVQQELQQGDAAIELVRYRWHDKKWTDTVHYAALIVTPEMQDHPHLVLLKNGNELEELGAQSYQSAFATRGASRVADGDNPIPADSLYAYFWQPIQKALDSLGGAGKVYLSPDGVYHTLNLQTLKNLETGKYLLETLDIERVGSTRDLVKKKKQQVPYNNAILAGYPSYPASPEAVADALQRYQQGQAMPVLTASLSSSNYGSYQTYRAIDSTRSDIDPLPGTLVEVEQVASILDRKDIDTQALLEYAASEDVLKKVKSPRILHIATHGFFEPEREQQAERLNRETLMSGLGRETVTENPYLQCGLYLAGAETTLKNRGNPDFRRPAGQEDGILTAYEATLLDLRGTELVVLSACETGLGITKNGEGVYGLQRAFQVAGAETVIFSLWKVADEQTQEMMGLLYWNWLEKGMGKREAFNAAQQTIKEKYEDPYFWGAFVMIGG